MKKFISLLMAVLLCFMMFSCGANYEDPHDGRCDFCGRRTNQRYAGSEMCWQCYENMNSYWDKKQQYK